MFVEQLEENEKCALMALLVSISKADGELSKPELDFLSTYSSQNDVVLNIDSDVTINEVCEEIKSNKGKVIVLQEIVKLAIADGHYDESERMGALTISEALGVEFSHFEKIEEWVIDGHNWVSRGHKMLVDA